MSRYTKASPQVYMHFMTRDGGWFCQFLEADLKTPLLKKLTFANVDTIRVLARRGEAWGDRAIWRANRRWNTRSRWAEVEYT